MLFEVVIVGVAAVGRMHPRLWPVGSVPQNSRPGPDWWCAGAPPFGAQQTAFLPVSLTFAAVQVNGFFKFPKDFTCPQSWEGQAARFRVGCLGLGS